jgi:uncharacterized membrane protein
MEATSRPRGEGTVLFAATLFLVLGIFNVIDGIVALVGDDHFAEEQLFFADLTFWGILMIAIGAFQLMTANLIFKRSANGQVAGIALCCFSLVAQLFFLPVFPIWSVIIMVVDVMIIYGLCVYDEHFV